MLERSAQLNALTDSFAQVRDRSHGRLVLVGGEAGAGKTTLVRRFCDEQAGAARILWGACDALFTPRPLGPLFDIAGATGGELQELVGSDARPHEVVAALLRELQGGKPTIVVLEDLHWADEATLDVFRLFARRVEAVSALVLASYRDDELGRDQSLRIVLGELPTGGQVERVKVEALSRAATAQLAEPHGVDADQLYRTTGGNPFFVTEVLTGGGERIPPTVRDAVLARAGRLGPEARELLDALAIEPQLLDDGAASLDECLGSGMLSEATEGLAFRHELARLTIEDAIAPNRRVALHRAALSVLEARPAAAHEPARLAHHAEAAGDAQAVLRHAPQAAKSASSAGAHREAAAQYARALRFAGGLPPAKRAGLFSGRAYECYLIDQLDQAIDAQGSALACCREAGGVREEGDSLRRLAQMLGFAGRTAEAAKAARKAVALLEPLGPGPELAMAYGKLAQRYANWEDAESAIGWGTRALELADRLGDTEILVYALVSVGAAEFRGDAPKGREKLERALELARAAGLEDHVGRAFLNLVWLSARQRSFALAGRYLNAALEYSGERGLDYWRLSLLAVQARLQLDQGRWAEAAESAALVLRNPRTAPVPRVLAGVVQSLVRARHGDPEVWSLLDAALAQAEPTGELQQLAPVAAARAETAWLEGRHDVAAVAAEPALELALRCSASWEIGALACWRRRAGVDESTPPGAAEPYALELAGDFTGAAELWEQIGCPYEAALALAGADDDNALRRSLDQLQRLGAQPAATIVGRRLRERGARGLPRGPRAATRQNPANLTARELDVLELVAEGLRNAQIAERLFLSEKTVGHHVSAILRKLGAHTRGEASAEAVRLGIVPR